MALPKQHRLQHRRDFNRVYRSGVRRKSRHLTLRALKVGGHTVGGNQRAKPSVLGVESDDRPRSHPLAPSFRDIQPTRVGITISTKVSKRATIRNRMKRQIKSAMFQLLPALSPGWWIVIIVRPGIGECDYWQFLRELEEMIKSLR